MSFRVFYLLQLAGQFSRFLLIRFTHNQGLSHAAALTFTTLLSLVPLITVILAIFTAFPMSDKLNQQLQNFVFSNFVPTSGQVLQTYLQNFSSKASQLSGVGFAFLLLTALLMMSNIDRAFNNIWQVTRKRSSLNVFLEYWAILSVGPLLMAASVAATSYLVSIPMLNDASTIETVHHLYDLAPLLASFIAFSLLYSIIPNRRIKRQHALLGGLLAAILFETAKHGFAFYITNVPTYEAIYGTLAILPIFLMWIYLSWIVTLLGAEFTYCISIFKADTCHANQPTNNLLVTYKILHELWLAQKHGHCLSISELSQQLNHMACNRLENLLNTLESKHFVIQTQEQHWMLSRDLSTVTLLQLYQAGPFILPSSAQVQQINFNFGDLTQLLTHVEDSLEKQLSTPIDQLFPPSNELS